MLDRKTKKMMTLYGALQPKSYVDRLYLARQKRGRGLISCEMCVKAYKNNIWYVRNSNETLMTGVRTIRILEIEGAKEKNEFKRDRQNASLNRFIIKFQYNGRSHWFKQRALWEYRARNKRKLAPSSAEMADKCSNFSSGIIKFRGLFSLRLGY